MVRVFLVTANVGSVFENVEKGLPIWLDEFISVIGSKKPEFVAVHFQETGGKYYINGSNVINVFFAQLVERMGQINFRRAEGYADSRMDLEDQWTALSSIYFVHESVQPHAVAIWDFQENCFKDVSSTPQFYNGSGLNEVSTYQKGKFPQSFFPNCKWSRKGFLRTRWRVDGKILDLVNIHLFHDADNLIAASSFPSEFAQCRENGLKYALKTLQNDSLEKAPLFIFGDFNFRVDTEGLVAALSQEFGDWKAEGSRLSFGSKTFSCPDYELRFLHSFEWFKKYDFEFREFAKKHKGLLNEFDINFHPTYPFEEEDDQPEKFLRTRPPSWCDRVLFTPLANDIISQESPVEYNVLGSKTCMGDHKPVYLSFILKSHSSPELPASLGQSPGKVPSPLKPCPSDSVGSTSMNHAPSTTLGPPQNSSRKCNCIVSLIKDNLHFPKCRFLSRGSSSDSVSTNSVKSNPLNHDNYCNICNNGIAEESQPLCKHFCNKNSIWRAKQSANEISEDDKAKAEQLIITDKQNKNDKLILPFSLPLVGNEAGEKKRDLLMSNQVEIPLNIQNLNVISSNSDKNSGKNLESSKLPFGWTKRRRDDEKSVTALSQTKSKESESLLCSKCVIL